MRKLLIATFGILLFLTWANLFSQEEKLGDISNGNRSKSVHRIKLIDHDSSVVRLDDQPLMPFSIKETCGECHDYQKIARGWHFNAGDSATVSGRPGHPWIYIDQQSSTQIPLSFRNWPGTYEPQQFGISTLQFLQTFGRHMPGGGVGENEDVRSLDNLVRWMISGDFEINCLSCHDAEFAHDQAEHAANAARQNFRWIATSTSAFSSVRGSAKDMPDKYDIYAGTAPDQAGKVPPQVIYDKSRFNSRNEVFFDITRNITNENCQFCHSTKILDIEKTERWHFGDDVHLTSGMKCVDCHRHGLDHDMVRGYERESGKDHTDIAEALSCRGCHYEDECDSPPLSGRSGAPQPVHPGIPPLHFEKLTCTTCHSGEWPASEVKSIKTSAGHALGMHGVNKSDTGLPHIVSPVFVRQSDGKIAPHNLIWPSFWAQTYGDSIVPLALDIIRPMTEVFVVNDDTLHTGDWLNLDTDIILKILDSLKIISGEDSEFAFISGGYIYSKNIEGQLQQEENAVAAPYSWPIAHDVRPARQSLGIRGCDDCHSTDAPFYYSQIGIDTPLNLASGSALEMIDFQDLNAAGAWVFSFSFLFRPWLKLIVIISLLVIAGVLLLYAFKGLSVITTNAAGGEK